MTEKNAVDIATLIQTIKRRPDYHEAGMILCHNGIVRAFDRQGRKVSGLRVLVDHSALDQIIAENKGKAGIVDIQDVVFSTHALVMTLITMI